MFSTWPLLLFITGTSLTLTGQYTEKASLIVEKPSKSFRRMLCAASTKANCHPKLQLASNYLNNPNQAQNVINSQHGPGAVSLKTVSMKITTLPKP